MVTYCSTFIVGNLDACFMLQRVLRQSLRSMTTLPHRTAPDDYRPFVLIVSEMHIQNCRGIAILRDGHNTTLLPGLQHQHRPPPARGYFTKHIILWQRTSLNSSLRALLLH